MEVNKLSRRDIVKKGTLGAVALSTIPLVGFADTNENVNLEAKADDYWKNKSAFITGGARGIGLAGASANWMA